MYGKGVRAKDHQEAAKLSGLFFKDRKLMRSRAKAGLDVLRKHDRCDPNRIAAIGYCFGGTTVLEMARAGLDLRGVASFHGGLGTPSPADAKTLQAKIMVFHGGEDGFTEPDLPKLRVEMKKAKADWQVVIFGGAVHSFTVMHAGNDPTRGIAYNENADRRSWEMLRDFLRECFR